MNTMFSDSLSETLIKNGIIKAEEKAVYAYGLRALGMWILCTVTMFIIGCVIGELLFTIMFFLGFSILRAFFAGIHAKSKVICFFCSMILFTVCALIGRYALSYLGGWIFGVFIAALGVIMNIMKFKEFIKTSAEREDEDESFERKRLFLGTVVTAALLAVWLVMSCVHFFQGCAGILMAFSCTFVLFIGNKLCKG